MAYLQAMSGICSLACSQLREHRATCQAAHQMAAACIRLLRMLCSLCKSQRSRAMATPSMQPLETCQSL